MMKKEKLVSSGLLNLLAMVHLNLVKVSSEYSGTMKAMVATGLCHTIVPGKHYNLTMLTQIYGLPECEDF